MTASKAFVREKIEKAKESLLAGENDDAVIALVELWAKVPATRLAHIVEKISATLPKKKFPKKVFDREQYWYELAASKDLRLVPSLISVEWPAHPRGVKERLIHLKEFPPDPRIAKALRELWIGGRYRSRAGEVFWRSAFRLLLNWKDPETSRVIGSAKATDDGYFIVEPILMRRTTPLPEEPPVANDLVAAFEEIEGLAGITTTSPSAEKLRAELFENVYRDPWSDEPRLVLGDLLVQEGDPRGELIQLMNAVETGRGTPKIEQRVKHLLRDSTKKWLDGIGGAVREPIFRSGFVVDVVLEGELNPEIQGWRTVETLRLDNTNIDVEVFHHPNLSALKRIEDLPFRLFEELVNIDVDLDYVMVLAPLDTMTIAPGNVRLKTKELAVFLSSSFDQVLHWFDTSPFKHQEGLKLEIDISATEQTLLEGLNYLRKNRALAQITYRGADWDVRLKRDESGNPTVLATIFHREVGDSSHSKRLAKAVAALPAETLTFFSATAATDIDPREIETITTELAAALKKQTALKTKKIFGAGY